MLSGIAKQLQRGSASVLAVADAPSDRTVPQRVSFCLIAVTAVDPSRSRTEPVPTGTSLRMESYVLFFAGEGRKHTPDISEFQISTQAGVHGILRGLLMSVKPAGVKQRLPLDEAQAHAALQLFHNTHRTRARLPAS